MFDLAVFVAGAAFFDSVSTTQQIVFLILLFSTEKPVRTALGFILGVSLAYLVCGLVGLALVDKLNDLVKLFVPGLGAVPDRAYYQMQALLGLGLAAAGPGYWWFKTHSRRPPRPHRWLMVLQRMNPWVAFALGAFLSVSSFPAAVPYIASLEKIAASGLPTVGQQGLVGLYNLVYAVPLLVPFLVFVFVRQGIEHHLHRHVEKLNFILTIVMLSGMGLLLLADSLTFFWAGKPLLASRFL